MKLKIIIGLAFLFSVTLTRCLNPNSDNTKLDSDNYESRDQRIDILKNEAILPTEIIDTEFELFNVNGFQNTRTTSVPGSSSWDYKFVVKIDTSEISKWTDGMVIDSSIKYNDSWFKQITMNRKSNWDTESSPEIFVRPDQNVTVLVFKKEGIICKRIINL